MHDDKITCGEGVKKLNIRASSPKEIETFIDDLNECEAVLSSSLHGIIIANAYGVPARYFRFKDQTLGGSAEGKKFSDYFQSVSMPDQQPIIFDGKAEISLDYRSALDMVVDLKIDLDLLLDVFPHDLVFKT